MKRTLGIAAAAVLATLALSGCVQQSGPTVVTFEVADQGTYKIELITDEQI
jgi:outer membrane murein-binding lipoprotein Lpp